MSKYFNTKAGNLITKGMLEYIEKQNNGLKQNSNVYINKLNSIITIYKETIGKINDSVKG